MTRRLKGVPDFPFAPIVAAIYGGAASILVFATPQWMFERGIVKTGLPALVSMAQPPLGDTARLLVAAAIGLLTILLLWPLLAMAGKVLGKHKGKSVQSRKSKIKPVDVPNFAPAKEEAASPLVRRPIFAGRDLGAPLMSDAAVTAGEELLLDTTMMTEPVVPPFSLDRAATPVDVPQTVPVFSRPSVFETAPAVEPVAVVPEVTPAIPPVEAPAPEWRPLVFEPTQFDATPQPAVSTESTGEKVYDFTVPFEAESFQPTPAPVQPEFVPTPAPFAPPIVSPNESVGNLMERLESALSQRPDPAAANPLSAEEIASLRMGAGSFGRASR